MIADKRMGGIGLGGRVAVEDAVGDEAVNQWRYGRVGARY